MTTVALQPFYPHFVPNQVLTNTQLNQLRTYLDQQTRLSRIRLVGTGIVCGLTWRIEEGSGLTICQGFGLTSDGFLIELDETAYTGVRPYTDPDVDEDGVPRYGPWRRSGAQIDLLELVDRTTMSGTDRPADARALAPADFTDRVLVLYLELEEIDLKSCLVTECDNKGLNIQLNVKALLMPKGRPLDGCADALRRLHVPRLIGGLRQDPALPDRLQDVTQAAQLNGGYRRIVRDLHPEVERHLQRAFRRYEKFLDLDAAAFDQAMTTLAAHVGVPAGAVNQYHYDFLRDLVFAHNEFIDCACALIPDCGAATGFPRHLMLGALDDEAGYRHHFAASPVRNVMHGDLARCIKLFERILVLIEHFSPGEREAIRLTPSHTEVHALGTRAVPFYYRLSETLRACWQPRDCCTSAPLWAYGLPHPDVAGYGTEALAYDYATNSFLRIEGHLAHACADAARTVRGLRHQHNLEFDLLCLYLDDQDAAEEALRQRLRGLMQEIAKLYEELRRLLREGEDGGRVEEVLAALRQRKADLARVDAAWGALRTRRKMHCDVGSLQADYLLLRTEWLCQMAHLQSLLPEFKTGPVEEEATARRSVLETLRVLLRRGEGLSKGTESVILILLLREDLDALRSLLPQDVRRFNYEAFLGLYKELLRLVIDIRFSVTTQIQRTLEAAASGDATRQHRFNATVIEALLPTRQQESVFQLFDLLHSCLPARFATIYYLFEAMRAADLSLFANFARAHDGLEHRAGVVRGGTFILVCEGVDSETERVVADFSLDGQVACCCPVPKELCLPPVALPDFVIARVPEDGGEPINLAINVRRNDARLSKHDPDPGADLIVELTSETSEAGADLQLDEGTPGAIRYRLAEPVAGLTDTFTYRLIDPSCDLADVGVVSVFLLPETPPEPTTGIIAGIVTDCETGERLPGVNVLISGTTLGTVTDANGTFTLPNVPEGTHLVNYRFIGYRNVEQTVTVTAGQTTEASACMTAVFVGEGQVLFCDSEKNPLDVYFDGTLAGTLAGGNGTGYLALDQATTEVAFFRQGVVPGTQEPIFIDTVQLVPGQMAGLILAGSMDIPDAPLNLILRNNTKRDGVDELELYLAHTGFDTPAVDIRLLNLEQQPQMLLASNLQYGQTTPYLSLNAQEVLIEVVGSATGQRLSLSRFNLTDLVGQALTLSLCPNARPVLFDVDGKRIDGDPVTEPPPQQTGTMLVNVVNARTGARITFASVRLLVDNAQVARRDAPRADGLYAFENMLPRVYTINAGASGFIPASLTGISLGPGQTRTVSVRMVPLIDVLATDVLVANVAERALLNRTDAGNRVREVVGTRTADRINVLSTIEAEDPGITTSVGFTTANTFLVETVNDPTLSEREVKVAYDKAASSLRSAIASAGEARTPVFRTMLETVTQAYLDRWTSMNPTEVTPEAREQLTEVVANLKNAGVNIRDFRTAWAGENLDEALFTNSVGGVTRLLR